MEMICENAGKCNVVKCNEKTPHEKFGACVVPCSGKEGGIKGSKCIPYVPASETKPLTDNAKYCRLSKQAGGLCGLSIKQYSCACLDSKILDMGQATGTWETCPIPSKQQPVELPKDPLEELIEEICGRLPGYFGILPVHDCSLLLREFAEKVRAL